MKKAKKILNSLIILSIFLSISLTTLLSSQANAASSFLEKQEGFGSVGSGPIAKAFDEDSNPHSPQEIAIRLIKVFLTFLGVIFLALIMLGGFKWMTSEGNDDTVKRAKATISRAIIGIIIILASYAITNFIGTCVMDIASGDTWYCAD